MKAISYQKVKFKEGFLGNVAERNRRVTIPAVYDRFFETGRIYAVTRNWPENADKTVHKFWDSDVAKWMESAAYALAESRDAALEEKLEELIDGILKYRLPDGYFNSCYGENTRFQDRDNHELYCAGHLIEAAAAHFESTGQDRFLKAVCRYADFIDDYFRVQKAAPFLTPGHEEIELALIRLYRATGEKRYLDLAGWFLMMRGANDRDKPVRENFSKNYQQDNVPVSEIREATGHAVRACYLYSAMADYAVETDNEALMTACKAAFQDITERKMYVTGGIGSAREGESFTIPYDLPNEMAYAETCAAIALFFFAHRMCIATGEAKYADVMETCLYNGILSGVSKSGDEFFYTNPLRLDRKTELRYTALSSGFPKRPLRHRVKMFNCSCCPPNLARFFASLGGCVFAENEETVFVNLFDNVSFNDGVRRVEVETEYPNGNELLIRTENVSRLAVRIPAWQCRSGKYITASVPYREENGYAVFEAPASPVTIRFEEYRPALIVSDPRVTENAGKAAVLNGPTVYCLEECDNPDVLSLFIDRSRFSEARAEWNEKEEWMEILVPGKRPAVLPGTGLYGSFEAARFEEVVLRFIPYRDFANRDDADMTVWVNVL